MNHGEAAGEQKWAKILSGDRRRDDVLSRSVFRMPDNSVLCVRGRRTGKAFHLAPPFGQKEARNEHWELGLCSAIQAQRRAAQWGKVTKFVS